MKTPFTQQTHKKNVMVGAATGNNVMSRNRVEISYFILILRLTLRDGRNVWNNITYKHGSLA